MRTSLKGGGGVLPHERGMGMCCWMACIFTTGFTIITVCNITTVAIMELHFFQDFGVRQLIV